MSISRAYRPRNRHVFRGSRANRDRRDASLPSELKVGDSVCRLTSSQVLQIIQIIDHVPVDGPRRTACIALLSGEACFDKPDWEFIWNLRRSQE